ncbi:hypothetical protein ACQPZP_06830 [Spirillospora sp. CA-142024]|uniref:hypothetical protein n=1 Tax=Spirillospora sp. CA-142024 TaxID=3240036 RepID=UPI003D8B504C
MDTERGLPRRPGEIRHTPAQGVPKVTPREGTPVQPPGAPIPPGAPTSPIVQAAPAPRPAPGAHPSQQGPPRVWGAPPRSPAPERAARVGAAEWAAVPEAQDAYSGREARPSTPEPMGVRETSGVQVRLGSRDRERERRAARRRAGRRGGLVAAGVLVLAGLVAIGLVLTPGSGDEDAADAPPAASDQAPNGGGLPLAGSPITVGTADGSKYRIAAVKAGVSDGVTTFQSSPPSGTAFPYIEYILGNPTDQKILLDFPGDVFVKRDLVTPEARGRCMPQAGVPEVMCTPPTKSQVVRRLAGGSLIPGDGGDKYLAPGASYLVRATVDVPVNRTIRRSDMGLYVWKQLYMADRLAKQAPFPSGK